jgi:hypothetical protein
MVITLGKQDDEVWHLPFSQVPPILGEPQSAAIDAEAGDFIAPLSFFKDRFFVIDALIELMPYFADNVRPYIHPSNGDVYLLGKSGASAVIIDGKVQTEKIDFAEPPPEPLMAKYASVTTPAFLNVASVPRLPSKLYFKLSDRDDAEEIELDLRTKWHIYSVVRRIPYAPAADDPPQVTADELLKRLSALCNVEYVLAACQTNAEKYGDITETPFYANTMQPKLTEYRDYHAYMLNLILTKKDEPLLYSRLLAVRFLLGVYSSNTERSFDI